MPPRTTPTVRQQRLGAELRKLRESAGMTASAAGSLLGVDQARISNIERGRAGISATRVRTLACNYACGNQALIEALAAMAGDRTRHWWEEYRGTLPAGQLDIAEMEFHATEIRTAQTSTLPGLLQTIDHARVVFNQGVPPLPPHEVEHRTSFRIKRQAAIYRDGAAPYTAVIHEAALRMQFGGPSVARKQLEHIIAASERDNVTVLVIPFSAGEFPGSGQTIMYAAGPTPELDTVQLDQMGGPVFHDAAAQLSRYRAVVELLTRKALTAAASRDFIHSIAHEL
ncbi:XRE family transcriptional regulator [Streptomyces albofaciens JCM 4342]|uniref:helix-turn-helix domain-containing protein n=1 Tax=Streptomyces albofaciens TaxID=66866 RepID=UPI00123ACF87|nr:helix-turn-helix transcriptional regulator [Streptomyces albofaciens]KAA6221024.1 XRE family transcriptional regulator [Streptomyces albofaciens JCM 4342]